MAQRNLKPPAVRDCPECHRDDGMKLQNTGIFSAHYVCERCGCSLTIPPPSLNIPEKDFPHKD